MVSGFELLLWRFETISHTIHDRSPSSGLLRNGWAGSPQRHLTWNVYRYQYYSNDHGPVPSTFSQCANPGSLLTRILRHHVGGENWRNTSPDCCLLSITSTDRIQDWKGQTRETNVDSWWQTHCEWNVRQRSTLKTSVQFLEAHEDRCCERWRDCSWILARQEDACCYI